MSFARTKYDQCEHSHELRESTGVLSYMLDASPYVNCSPCRMTVGLTPGNDCSTLRDPKQMVDLESDLMGITREASRCALMKYLPTGRYVQGHNFYRTSCEPKIDTTVKHLPACQMFELPARVPEPGFAPFQCPKH